MGIDVAKAALQLVIENLEHCIDGPEGTPDPPHPPPVPTGGPAVELWTPIIGAAQGVSDQRYRYQTGYLVRQGPLVTWWAYVQFDSQGTMRGSIRLEGFPYPTATVPGFFGGGCSYSSNLSPSANDVTSIDVWTSGSRKDWNLFGRRLGQNPRPLVAEDINAATQLILHGSYLTD